MKKYFKTTERSSYHIRLSAEEYKLRAWTSSVTVTVTATDTWATSTGTYLSHTDLLWSQCTYKIYSVEQGMFTYNMLEKLSVMEKKCSQNFVKNIPCEQCHTEEKVKNVQISGSVLYKNKIQEFVFLLAEACLH